MVPICVHCKYYFALHNTWFDSFEKNGLIFFCVEGCLGPPVCSTTFSRNPESHQSLQGALEHRNVRQRDRNDLHPRAVTRALRLGVGGAWLFLEATSSLSSTTTLTRGASIAGRHSPLGTRIDFVKLLVTHGESRVQEARRLRPRPGNFKEVRF